MKVLCIGAQGEIRIEHLSELPHGVVQVNVDRTATGAIISHSESGNHHVLTGDCDIFEDAAPPAGMKILYAILRDPQSLIQEAPVPHEKHELPVGIVAFRMRREFDPFAEQARRVAD